MIFTWISWIKAYLLDKWLQKLKLVTLRPIFLDNSFYTRFHDSAALYQHFRILSRFLAKTTLSAVGP
jgi:hypothetical protein